MNRVRTALGLAALVLVAGCTGDSSRPAPERLPAQLGDCPTPDPAAPHYTAAVDYVDFIQAFGEQYVAGLASRPIAVAPANRGHVVLRSRCAYSALNDRTHQNPGMPRDGDTGFLTAGTPIYAIHGWPVRCRLTARSAAYGGLVAYLALQPNTKSARPRACALRH